MKKTFKKLFFSILIVILFCACSDPVFYYISQEPPKVEPKITGASANFVTDSAGDIYTASGSRLYKYSSLVSDPWTESSITVQNSGNRLWIRQLAITNKYLYAVCDDLDSKIIIVKADLTVANASEINNLVWSGIETINNIQSIFAVNDTLYISARNTEVTENNDLFSIYYLKDDAAVIPVVELDKVSQLIGAAYDGSYYYLCTKSGYYFSNTSDFLSSGDNFCQILFSDGKTPSDSDKSSGELEFTGIIKLGTTTVVAITRSGKLYKINTLKKELDIKIDVIAGFSDNRRANGALAIWHDGTNSLLLAGRQDINYSTNTGHTYGYVELEFDASGIVITQNWKCPNSHEGNTGNICSNTDCKKPYPFWVPGEAGKLTTVPDRSRYVNSIGKNPVNHIIQAKDKTLFASTQKNGVWSYRLRGNDWQWNAEE